MSTFRAHIRLLAKFESRAPSPDEKCLKTFYLIVYGWLNRFSRRLDCLIFPITPCCRRKIRLLDDVKQVDGMLTKVILEILTKNIVTGVTTVYFPFNQDNYVGELPSFPIGLQGGGLSFPTSL